MDSNIKGDTMNNIKIYPIPDYVIKQEDFLVRVRPPHGEWQEVPSYQVIIDMRDQHPASMSTFDFEGQVEVEVSSSCYLCTFAKIFC